MTCERRTDLGAYLLGALTPDEAASVAEHLTECQACADELQELAWVSDMLLRVPAEQVERLDVGPRDQDAAAEPSPAVLQRLLARTRTERRSRTRRVMLAAAAAVVIGLGTGATMTTLSPQSHPSTVTSADPQTHVSATVTVSPRRWGSALALSVHGAYPGGVCSLIAHSRDGRSEVAATWVAAPNGTAEVPGSTAIPADQLTRLDVVSAGQQLVRIDLPAHR